MSLSEERLADIRERHSAGLGLERPGDVAALLAEVDRLRAGIEALADAHRLHDRYAYALLHGDDVRALLNPPTEGETDE